MAAGRLRQQIEALAATRATLLAIDPDMQDDFDLWHDMLEGETSDAFVLIDSIARYEIETELLLKALSIRAEELDARKARLTHRRDRLRTLLQMLLEAGDLRKHVREDFELRFAAGRSHVVITDEGRIPAEFFKVERTVMRKEIGDKLRGGESVPGCELSNPQRTLAIVRR